MAVSEVGVDGAMGAGETNAAPVYRIRFGDPAANPVIASGVASFVICSAIWAGVAVGSDCNSNTAAPATCGEAIEVPESMRDALDEVIVADMMLTPGANTSTHDP